MTLENGLNKIDLALARRSYEYEEDLVSDGFLSSVRSYQRLYEYRHSWIVRVDVDSRLASRDTIIYFFKKFV